MDYHVGGTRERWTSRNAFLATTVGCCCGLATSLRLPFLAARHGGMFVWVYFVAVLVLGYPVMLLELAVGQFKQKGATGAYESIHPRLVGIGYGAGWMCLLATWCYAVLAAYACLYFYDSTFSPLPWMVDHIETNPPTRPSLDLARDHFAGSISEVGQTFSMQLLIALAWTWIVLFWLSFDGVVASGNFAATCCVLFVAGQTWTLIFSSSSLSGSGDGFSQLVSSGSLTSAELVVDAVCQALFSCNAGSAVLISFGSFNEPNRDVVKYAAIAAGTVLLASLLTAAATFCAAGHLLSQGNAYQAATGSTTRFSDIPDMVQHGEDAHLGVGYRFTFEVAAAVASAMDASVGNCYSVVYFAGIASLALLTLHAWTLAGIGILRDIFEDLTTGQLAAIVCSAIALGSLPFVFGDIGYEMVTVMDKNFVRVALPIAVACETGAVCWGGQKRFSAVSELIDSINESGKLRMTRAWCWLLEIACLAMIVCAIVGVYLTATDDDASLYTAVSLCLIGVYPALVVFFALKAPAPPSPTAVVEERVWGDRELTAHSTEEEIHIPE
ncbi:Sodium-dependent dopamine transporter [Diplonema papillatum]|nr:Sodium-dependent dopamine transporter [Diplonema papillatum]KAJ9440353.1 Sodium-dependent dopamine transporter [Diplonema papillatum]